MNEGKKICNKCKIEKSLNEFYNQINTSDGKHNRCKKCHSECNKLRRLNYPDRVMSITRKSKYGISEIEYKTLYEKQNGVCAICYLPETKMISGILSSLSIDHCHTTNKVRGLLCASCNALLGFSKDNIKILQRSIEYLNENSNNI